MTRRILTQPVPIEADLFKDANPDPDRPMLPEMPPAYHEAVTELFPEDLDVMREYSEIEDSIRIQGAVTPGAIQAAANDAEHMALRAARLHRYAKIDIEACQAKVECVHAALREAATAKLEEMKAKKIRTKAITDADVVSTMAQYWPDEWQAALLQRAQLHGTLRMFERLAELTKGRCKSLTGMNHARDVL